MTVHRRGWLTRILLALSFCFAVVAWAPSARAYAWMVRHEYTGCNQCHADPSGGGLLTPYGRAQGEILLRSQYTHRAEDEEPGKLGDFAFGLVPLPESVLLGGDYRLLYLNTKVGDAPANSRLIQMQADLEGQIAIDRVRANASVGYDHNGAQAAAITQAPMDNVVSRVHWIGVDLGADRQLLLRAGRMNLPYGLRSIEHTAFIHAATRTDLNDAQQHGLSLAYNGSGIRGEAMLILGNFQLNPDPFRERGYSAFAEWAPTEHAAVGVSSKITYAARDLYAATPSEIIRHAHGVFGRIAAFGPLVLLAEADLLVQSRPPAQTDVGYTGMLQADVEVWQGLHLMATGEVLDAAPKSTSASFGAWGSVAWFFAPHADVRSDFIYQSLAATPGPVAIPLPSAVDARSFLVQLHVYL